MKRILSLALLVGAAWAGTATSSFAAGAFGLFPSPCCGGCSFCLRPYNAFSPLTCGVADTGCPYKCPGFGGGCCKGGGCNSYVPPSYDNGCSAFGSGARIGFSGVPACGAHLGFGCC